MNKMYYCVMSLEHIVTVQRHLYKSEQNSDLAKLLWKNQASKLQNSPLKTIHKETRITKFKTT